MIEICEVGLRDGLQNEQKILSTEIKVQLICRLIESGIRISKQFPLLIQR
jgi:hydroxymethylglutaryl-CoA lyase